MTAEFRRSNSDFSKGEGAKVTRKANLPHPSLELAPVFDRSEAAVKKVGAPPDR